LAVKRGGASVGQGGLKPPTPGNSIGVKMKEEKREEQRKKRE